MFDESFKRRLRGAIGSGLLWGAGWSALWALVVVLRSILGLVGVLPPLTATEALGGLVRFGVAFGMFGFLAGTAGSAILGLVHRGRSLDDISSVRFGLGGGVLAGLLVPLLMQLLNLLSGDGMVAWSLVTDDMLITGLFGGLAAGGTMAIAKRTDRLLPTDTTEDPEPLPGTDEDGPPGDAATGSE